MMPSGKATPTGSGKSSMRAARVTRDSPPYSPITEFAKSPR